MATLILTHDSRLVLCPLTLAGHHIILSPPQAQITGRGHATINAQQIITQEDAQSFMQEVNYITTKGHSIPGKAIVKIDMAKLIVSKGCFSENNIVLHENKLPLTLSVSIPAKIPGNPPQDDTVGMSSGEGTLIVSNFHVYADR